MSRAQPHALPEAFHESGDQRNVAGPTLAHWLRYFGHEPVLFDKARSYEPEAT
jgi:hypothetical protein